MRNVGSDVGLDALVGLLGEFSKGNIVDAEAEREGYARHVAKLSEGWDQRFPGFPREYFPFTSFKGEYYRGKRDAYLKDIIVRVLARYDDGSQVIVNPACVFGRHSRTLAARLRSYRVIATDIDRYPSWLYHNIRRGRTQDNHEFVRDNIFDPKLTVRPTAVVFFGACGAVSDGAIDYAINSHSPYLMCRTCCHENIGGNTVIAKRRTCVNRLFRLKNWGLDQIRKSRKYVGFYFSDRYAQAHYPTSVAARGVSDPRQFLEACRNSTDSDICRAIIDLDRYLRLVEHGYRVWYRGELFVAEKAGLGM